MRWQSLLQEIRALKLELARLDPRAGMPVLPPAGAGPRAVDAVERRIGRPLPPTYRALLAQHDGFPHLYHGAGLLGARALSRATYLDLAHMVIGLPDLVPFGVDAQAETFFAWDIGAERAGGELEIVVWINEIGERLESFPALLELVREMLTAEVDDRRRAPLRASRRRATIAMPSLSEAAA